MADDLGPGWVDFNGNSEKINTPNLEHMAKSGMIFLQGLPDGVRLLTYACGVQHRDVTSPARPHYPHPWCSRKTPSGSKGRAGGCGLDQSTSI